MTLEVLTEPMPEPQHILIGEHSRYGAEGRRTEYVFCLLLSAFCLLR